MDFAKLKAFLAVAQSGNLTRAAERLFLTQPALSLQLKKLEDELGVSLFARMPRGMRLTQAGQQLLPAAERALAAALAFDAAAEHLKGNVAGNLRLGSIVDPEFLRLGACLHRLAERYPGLSFELRHGMSGAMAREVEEGQLDVAFTLGEPGLADLQERFHVQELTRLVYRVVAPAHWGTQIRGKDWRELSQLPWIGTPPASVHHRLLRRIAKAGHFQFNVVAQVDLEPSMLDLVRSGVALSLVRDSLALHAAHTEGVAIADRVAVDAALGLVCRKDRRQEAPIQAAMQTVAEVWGRAALPTP